MAVSNIQCSYLWCILIIVCSVGLASAQEQASCYGPGSIATSVILTFIFTVLLLGALYFWWKRYRAKKEQLILETDPEKGKGEFAFDNPGFKDTSILPATKPVESNKLETSKSKWNQWSPLSALTTKSEKRKTLDDTALEANEVKVIALRSHDFTGLGFNICGNMKDGIYIKDILHRGPAFESGKLNPGDRINSVTISFEHMVYEDALTILSYASPYEVIIEARGGKLINNTPGQGGQPSHPVYRSSSCTDLYPGDKSSKKKLFGDDFTGSLSSNYSSLQKSRSNMTTLERKESKSPKPTQPHAKKTTSKHLSPEQLKTQLEQRILADHQHNLRAKDKPQKVEAEAQKTENKHQKFGIRVLPLEQQQKSPKSMEQNENNINIERNLEVMPAVGIDEVDETKKQAPQVKKREKKHEGTPEKTENFERLSLNGSGIKRDKDGIPQEIPSHMFNAAVAARRNRRSSADDITNEEDDSKTPKRKGKAPSPPEETKTKDPTTSFDEIQLINDDIGVSPIQENRTDDSMENLELEVRSSGEEVKEYNSDSDIETDNQSSVNTIELNSSDITIHQTEEEERQNRKTASTGDLSKIHRTRKPSTGTLERAQSLDITDTGMPTLTKKRKEGRIEDTFDMKTDEDLLGKVMLNKEPRLSLILDGLNTFQRNRLKKSTEWGNLEDAILKLNQEEERITSFEDTMSLDKYSFSDKSPEFNALVNKINEIKRDSRETAVPLGVVETPSVKTEKKVKNQIWPTFQPEPIQPSNGNAHIFPNNGSKVDIDMNEKKINEPVKTYEKRQQIPVAPERTLHPPLTEETNSKPDKKPQDNERTAISQFTEYMAVKRQQIPVAPERSYDSSPSIDEVTQKPNTTENKPSEYDTASITLSSADNRQIKKQQIPVVPERIYNSSASTDDATQKLNTSENKPSEYDRTSITLSSADSRQIRKQQIPVVPERSYNSPATTDEATQKPSTPENKPEYNTASVTESSTDNRQIRRQQIPVAQERSYNFPASTDGATQKPNTPENKTSEYVRTSVTQSSADNRQFRRQQIPIAVDRTSRPSSPTKEFEYKIVSDKKPFENIEIRQVNPVTSFEIPTPIYKEDAQIAFSNTELNPKVPQRITARQRVPEDSTVLPPVIGEILPEPVETVLKEDWNISVSEDIMNTSPPASLEIVEGPVEEPTPASQMSQVEEINAKPPLHNTTTVLNRSEEVLSKIPLLNSMVKSQKEEALKKPVLSTNSTDETKTVVTYNTRPTVPNLLDVTQNFLYTEQLNSNQDDYSYSVKPYDTNISDDIKVSRHSQGSLERQKASTVPKSDDAKSDSLRHVSNVNVTNVANGDTDLHSLELSINEPSELYTTALDSTMMTESKNDSKVTISTPDLIKNVTLAEAINTLNSDVTIGSPATPTVEVPKDLVEVTENKFSTLTESPKSVSVTADKSSDSDNSKNSSTLTYITEIQVLTPNNSKTNISEIEIIPDVSTKSNGRNLESEFENYVKNFESKLERFESNIQDFDKNIDEFIKEEPKSVILNEKVDEKELHKIQEIAEEQLKKLPEMRFTTSSYESSRIPEKRQSQIELLRSNFEKSPSKPHKPDVAIKSRIPIATMTKTPPTSPERRDSRTLDTENDKAILELMSSTVTSTPYTTSKYQIKPPSKNVTVTSIRSNSKIPSGLPTLSGSRPPIAPRKVEPSDGNVVQVSTNGNVESSFKQWVFNPSNVTNVVVTESKQDKC